MLSAFMSVTLSIVILFINAQPVGYIALGK